MESTGVMGNIQVSHSRTCARARTHTNTPTRAHTRMHIHICTHTNILHMHKHASTHMHAQTHTAWTHTHYFALAAIIFHLLGPQVVEDCCMVLKEYGFRFVRRGPIFVKGKGELLTYFLKGKDKPGTNGTAPVKTVLPHQVLEHSWPLAPAATASLAQARIDIHTRTQQTYIPTYIYIDLNWSMKPSYMKHLQLDEY